MGDKRKLHLAVHEGGRKELGRRMLRAHLDRRYEDARALVDRIAHRASLAPVDPLHYPEPGEVEGIDAHRPDEQPPAEPG